MSGWAVERIVHFGRGDFVEDGLAHFGFHTGDGRYVAIAHDRHRAALVGPDGELELTIAAAPFAPGVPNVAAELDFPIYADVLPDASVLVSNFGDARLYRVEPATRRARLLVDGNALGLADMGNCVVAGDGSVWVNEVMGCRIHRFDERGRLLETLGDGTPSFQAGEVPFAAARFSWVYDLRPGPDGNLYVLDARNFAVRAIDPGTRTVRLVAGTGAPGYSGDGGDARAATFGGDTTARFDGPISLAVDERGTLYVGDRFNRVVRMIRHGIVSTIAGSREAAPGAANDPGERDPLHVRLPSISSMDYAGGRLFVPTDLDDGSGDLVVLRRDG